MFCFFAPLFPNPKHFNKMISRIFCRKFSIKRDTATIKQVFTEKPVGSEKTIQGWATSIRKMGKTVFIDVNDGSCINSLQVVLSKENLEKPLANGSSICVTGVLQNTSKGQLELHTKAIDVVGNFDMSNDYPFDMKRKQSYDLYRQFLHLRPKVKYFSSMMRFRSAAVHIINQYFNKNGFTLIHTPILTSGDCEGAAETFMVKPGSQELINVMKGKNTSNDDAFFNSPAYLTVSGQLHLEVVARSITKVYTFNTSFRAENSVSRLHLSEFYMVEAEEAFVTSLEFLLQRIEDLVKEVTNYLLSNLLDEIEYMLKHNETDLKEHMKILENVINTPFLVISFSEAKNLIHKNLDKIQNSSLTPFNLTKAEEIFLVKYNNNAPVFVINWPKKEKPFYMKQISENPDLVKGVDLLMPNIGELCGGSVREDDYDILKERLTEMKLVDCLQWYLELRKFGNVPTAGFGLGFERFLQFLLNVQSIKDVIPFPRYPHHLQL